jgi:hypothetical protein
MALNTRLSLLNFSCRLKRHSQARQVRSSFELRWAAVEIFGSGGNAAVSSQ